MDFDLVQRATLLIDYMGGPHLNVVLHGVEPDGLHLLAPISSVKEGRFTDRACVLEAGDHEFLKRESYVVYAKMHEIRTRHIVRMVVAKIYEPKGLLSGDVFARVVNGVFKSDEVRTRRVDEIRRSGLLPV